MNENMDYTKSKQIELKYDKVFASIVLEYVYEKHRYIDDYIKFFVDANLGELVLSAIRKESYEILDFYEKKGGCVLEFMAGLPVAHKVQIIYDVWCDLLIPKLKEHIETRDDCFIFTQQDPYRVKIDIFSTHPTLPTDYLMFDYVQINPLRDGGETSVVFYEQETCTELYINTITINELKKMIYSNFQFFVVQEIISNKQPCDIMYNVGGKNE